ETSETSLYQVPPRPGNPWTAFEKRTPASNPGRPRSHSPFDECNCIADTNTRSRGLSTQHDRSRFGRGLPVAPHSNVSFETSFPERPRLGIRLVSFCFPADIMPYLRQRKDPKDSRIPVHPWLLLLLICETV